MRDEALSRPGLYLFALPTINLIREQAEAFRRDAPGLEVTEVHSEAPGKGAVFRRLEEARQSLVNAATSHAIMLTTHEAIMSHDLSQFAGWHARVDEAPNAVHAGRLNISVSRGFYQANFGLKTYAAGWSEVQSLGKSPNWKEVERDTVAKAVQAFQKHALRPHGVFVNVGEWSGADHVEWFSLWSPLGLRAFGSVQIAGAGYLNSLGYKVAKSLFEKAITFVERAVPMARTAFPKVRLHYFTDSHEGTTSVWDSSEGRKCIVAVCDYLDAHVPSLGFWSANDMVQKLMEWRIAGTLTSPKASGLNRFRDETACAFIYSSKPVPDDIVLKNAFKLSDEDIRASREDEDVAQFVMRGAIRNGDFGGTYDAYLYSRVQVERLAAYLEASHISRSIELIGIREAGLMDQTLDAASGQRERTPEELEAAKVRKGKRAAKRARDFRARRARAAGRKPGKSGRPTKT